MMSSAGILALLLLLVVSIDVSAQGAARVASRVASARVPASAPLIVELRPNTTHGAFRAIDDYHCKRCRPVVFVN